MQAFASSWSQITSESVCFLVFIRHLLHFPWIYNHSIWVLNYLLKSCLVHSFHVVWTINSNETPCVQLKYLGVLCQLTRKQVIHSNTGSISQLQGELLDKLDHNCAGQLSRTGQPHPHEHFIMSIKLTLSEKHKFILFIFKYTWLHTSWCHDPNITKFNQILSICVNRAENKLDFKTAEDTCILQ